MVLKAYKKKGEILEDYEYHNSLKEHSQRRRGYPAGKQKRILDIWKSYMEMRFEKSKEDNSVLGKFIRKYDLPLKELACLLEIMEDESYHFDRKKDIFSRHSVRYGVSLLKKHKLVFKMTDPMSPGTSHYEVSYKAQLDLHNKKYTEEYEQLDMALEEESKQNSPDALDNLYYAIDPKTDFKELIVDDKTKNSLMAAISRERQQSKIFDTWGLGKTITYGKGTTLNFRGPPGTGKTMAAHCLAKELGKKLLSVRYDQLQSMWVGGTEKHIQKVFRLAKVKKAVLFFDEADAIALERETLSKSWEMSQVNTLLKELERFEGVCIFATNFAEKYDKAFERRLTMHIDFEMPTSEQGLRILEIVLPKKAREKGMQLKELNLEGLSGGMIKNIALNAAGFAARDNSKKIALGHLQEAVSQVRFGESEEKAVYIQ